MGSEGSSRPALRTYFVGDYFTGTPFNISELSGECWGVTGCWLSVSPSGGYAACVGLSMRTAEAPARVCVVPPRGSTRASSRKTRELAIQVHLCVVILLDFASRVLGIGP